MIMDFKDYIYKNRELIGLSNDITYDKLVNLENMSKQFFENKNSIQVEKDIKELIRISTIMRSLLIECRENRLPIDLAKKIDNILRDAKNLD